MATLEPVEGGTGEIAFELERYEFKGDDRVEISGRWSGVRGRRFIRPTLTVMTGGRGSRSLADLEHKPWAPEEGKLWMAAFSCTLEDASALEAELNVAPDITITLPAMGDATAAGAKRAKRERPGREPRVRRELLERPVPPRRSGARPSQESTARREAAAIKTTMDAAIADKERLLHESDAEKERLQGELAASKTEQAQLKARVEELTAELDRAVAARNSALAARDQAVETAQRSVAERDTAVQAQEEAVAARDAALESRDAAVESRDAAVAMREEALNARDESDAAANAALLARDHALAQRDAADTARGRAVADRETLAEAADQLRNQHEDDLATRGAQLVMRNATIASGAGRRHAGWTKRTIAIIVVLAVVLALLIVLHLV